MISEWLSGSGVRALAANSSSGAAETSDAAAAEAAEDDNSPLSLRVQIPSVKTGWRRVQ